MKMKTYSWIVIQWLVWLQVLHQSKGYFRCPACLFFTDGNSIKRINTSVNFGVHHAQPYTVLDNIPGSYALDVDSKTNTLFWSEQMSSWKIRSMNLTTGTVKDIVKDTGEVEGIAVDSVHGNIYWTDYTYVKIEVASYNGSLRKTLFNKSSKVAADSQVRVIYNPKAIALHPTKGFMYWVDVHYFVDWFGFQVDYQEIARSTLAGTEYKSLRFVRGVPNHNMYPLSLTVDTTNDRLYYFNSVANLLASMDIYGNNYITHHVSGHSATASELTQLGSTLYWTVRNGHSIEKMQMETWRREINFGWLSDSELIGIAAYNSSKQDNVSTACTLNNGNCSHLCLLTPTGRLCACPNGVDLLQDNMTCSNETHVVPPSKPREIKVRLANGKYPSEGRVEIYVFDQWGTICNDNFDMTEANVVCRMLNYSRALAYVDSVNVFGKGPSSFLIFLDQVKCRGDEKSLSYCNHEGWVRHDCSHAEDIGVKCDNGTTHKPIKAFNNATDLKIELRDGKHPWEGRVEVLNKGQWGTICDRKWTLQDANVICKMLGYNGAWDAQGLAQFGKGTGKIWTSDTICDGSESSIGQCPSAGWGSPLCGHDHDVSVSCKPNATSDGKIRLRGGKGQSEGYIEIKYKGDFGWSCDSQWNLKSANVACRELGFPSALKALGGSAFGKGYGSSTFFQVVCNGNESSLLECEKTVGSTTYCSNAGLICKDLNTMPLQDVPSFMVIIDKKREMLYQVIPKPGDNQSTSIPFPIDIYSPDVVAFNPLNRTLYITSRYKGIYLVNLFKGTSKLIIEESYFIYSLAVDHVCKKLYWTLFYGDKIMVSDLDGSNKMELFRVDYPAGIALHIRSGLMYYLADDEPASLYRAHMDGSHREKIITLPKDSKPFSLNFDENDNVLYWIENRKIKYFNLSRVSSGIQTLHSEHIYHPYELTTYGNYLYWTERNTGRYSGGLYRSHWSTSQQKHVSEVVLTGLMDPSGVSAVGDEIVPENTACVTCNCQTCFRIPSGHQCNCSGISIYDSSIKKCVLPDMLMYLNYFKEAAFIMPEKRSLRGRTQQIKLKKSYMPKYLECDPVEQRLYYGDTSMKMIARIFINGSSEEVIISNTNPTGLSIDYIGRNLYFTETQPNSISASKLDGSNRKTLISTPQKKPSAIVVHSITRYLYWGFTETTNFDTFTGIGRAYMDGRNSITLLKWTAGYSFGPSQMTIDETYNRLYWVGWHDAAIEYINLYPNMTSATRIQITAQYANYLFLPNGIATTNTTIYWTDEWGDALYAGNHQGTGAPSYVVSYEYGIAGLRYCKASQSPPSEILCDGQCSHLCLISPTGSYCACPDNSNSSIGCHNNFPTTTAAPPTTTPLPTTSPPPTTTSISTSTMSPTTTEEPYTQPTEATFFGTCSLNPCQNGGECKENATIVGHYWCKCPDFYIPPESCEIFVGDGVIVITVLMELNDDEVLIFVDTLEDEFILSNEEGSRKKRAVPTSEVKIYSVKEPDRTEPGKTTLNVAGAKKAANGKITQDSIVPSKDLEANVKKILPNIQKTVSKRLNKKVTVLEVKSAPVGQKGKPGSTGMSTGSIVAVSVIVALLVLIVIGASLYIFVIRPRKVTGRYAIRNQQRDAGQNDLGTFSNPGFGAEAPSFDSPTDGEIAMSEHVTKPDRKGDMTVVDNPSYASFEPGDGGIRFTEKAPAMEKPRPQNLYESTVIDEKPPIPDRGNEYENPQDVYPGQSSEWEKFEDPSENVYDNVREGRLTLDDSEDQPED